MLIKQDYFPDMPEGDEWQSIIRQAIADADNPRHVTITHPAGTLQLDACTRVGLDGRWSIPLWDEPMEGAGGKVTSTRLDGDKLVIRLDDGHGWDDLAERLDAHLDGWDTDVMLTLSELSGVEHELVKVERRLAALKHQRRNIARKAHDLGVTKYRIAEVTGRSEVTVAGWMR